MRRGASGGDAGGGGGGGGVGSVHEGEGDGQRGPEPDGEAPLTFTYLCIGILPLLIPHRRAAAPGDLGLEPFRSRTVKPFLLVLTSGIHPKDYTSRPTG